MLRPMTQSEVATVAHAAAEQARALETVAWWSGLPPAMQQRIARARGELEAVQRGLGLPGLQIGCCGPSQDPLQVGGPRRGQFVMPFAGRGPRVGARVSSFGSRRNQPRVPQLPLPAYNGQPVPLQVAGVRRNQLSADIRGSSPYYGGQPPIFGGGRLVARANRAPAQSLREGDVILRVGAPVKILRKETLTIARRPNKLTIGGNLLRRMFGRR